MKLHSVVVVLLLVLSINGMAQVQANSDVNQTSSGKGVSSPAAGSPDDPYKISMYDAEKFLSILRQLATPRDKTLLDGLQGVESKLKADGYDYMPYSSQVIITPGTPGIKDQRFNMVLAYHLPLGEDGKKCPNDGSRHGAVIVEVVLISAQGDLDMDESGKITRVRIELLGMSAGSDAPFRFSGNGGATSSGG